jgi:hypothetical protein
MEVIFLDCGAGGPQLKRDPLGCTMNCQPFARPRLANSAGSQGTARVLAAVPTEDRAARKSPIDPELRTLVRPG